MLQNPTSLAYRYVFIIIALLLLSCKSELAFDEAYSVVAEATLKPGAVIPTPKAELLLTVTGKVKNMNHDKAILMDRPTIEAVGLVEYTVTDPFEQRPVRYRGVLMRDLLDRWQVADDATTMQLTALNDYKIDIPLAEFRQYPILFALQADGLYMQPDYRGPAMLVYPVDQYQFERLTVQRKWIWQIKAIDIQ